MMTPSTPPRIRALDALRGLAVIGIVGMNVHAFALPGPAYYNPLSFGGTMAVDRWVWLVSFVFIEDKFRTLFAMLFGAGCLILLEKGGSAKGTGHWRAHFARMAVLFIIGLIHATLLASNDVLRAYAIAGLAVVVASVLLLSKADPFPGWNALYPCLGAAMLIMAGDQATANRFVLATPILPNPSLRFVAARALSIGPAASL